MKILTPVQRIKSFEKKQVIASALALLIFIGAAVILNTLHLQSVAEESTRFLSRMVRIGDIREASVILHQARLSSFTSIQYKSIEPDRSFIVPTKAEVFKDESLWKKITTDNISVKVGLYTSTSSDDVIIFEYQKFQLVPYAFLIWIILNLISIPQTRFLKRRLIEQFKKDIEIEKKLAKSELAYQIRHNLRTPVAALMRIPAKLPESVSKDKELLELTIKQIRDLISKLDDRPNPALVDTYETDIYKTLEQARRELAVIIPKSVDFNFEIEDIVTSAFVRHIPFELRSILGNLVNNSLEAIGVTGKIRIRVRDLASEISISVSDDGCGIKPDSLSKVFEKHFSEGKKNGSGIGLSHAKEHIDEWRGNISVESTLGVGTTVNILLPVEERASWYLPRLKFNSASKIYVLDDQESGRALWHLKFDDTQLLQQTKFMSQGHELAPIIPEILKSSDKCTLLFDYDLGGGDTGLKWLKEMPSDITKCLVTGHFDNDEVRAACTQHGFYLIPKSEIAALPLVIQS